MGGFYQNISVNWVFLFGDRGAKKEEKGKRINENGLPKKSY